MRQARGAIQVGDVLPAVRLKAATGEDVELSIWRGRPLLIVCLRYYG